MAHRISYKLIMTTAVVSIAIIGVFSYYILTSQREALIYHVKDHAHQLSETIKSSTNYDMLLNQRDRVHRTIDMIAQQDGIKKVRVFNKEGTIIYSSDKAVIGTMVDTQAEACFACHAADSPLEKLATTDRTRIFESKSGTKNLGIINPIYNEPSCWTAECHAHSRDQKVLGVLDVTMSLDEVERQMSADRTRFLLFALIAVFAISLLIWIIFENLVGKPVGRLMVATNQIAKGDLAYKIEVKRNDELGHLGNSFNEMMHKLAEAQKQLVQSDKLASLGRLAAGVAHEINNPLTGVLTYSSLLLRRCTDDAETKEDLEVIVRETKRCREIVKQLLDFSRQAPTKKVEVGIVGVIENALSIVGHRLSLNNIVVVREIESGLPTVDGDPNQILQVFINVLVNAADSIGVDGKITISARICQPIEQCGVEVVIRDTGCGIPREAVGKVFEPFFTTKENSGTGLGLAVVWGIIDRHGGEIDLASEVGEGTAVRIRLPATNKTSESTTPVPHA
ncbi:MAG: hypothetical protein A2289_06195 [Deltaproteobacteria bacterium RIFOXYA12_FULL_58_15]|nr:MAG: hypothetical protein A2289_06195 [Deltaproteobacteria bacterium RIFOXYA12_FULL_58_15]OGR09873.1 MAG: hypothetical protein A2341_14320 [Deltaproteobacteria bacterium RIFOXYB12_FULL_58_9]